MARIMLFLAGFLALLPILHHHGPTLDIGQFCVSEAKRGAGPSEDEHSERFCVLATLQKSTTVDAFPPAIAESERLNEPTVAMATADRVVAELPRNLSPRAPPTF